MGEVFTYSRILNRCGQLFDDLPRCSPFPLRLFLALEQAIHLSKRALHLPQQRWTVSLLCTTFCVLEC